MTTKDLLEYHVAITEAARELMAKKNHDYAGESGETPFANFEVAPRLGICSAETAIEVRLGDKIKRIVEYVKSGRFKVEDEGLRDTVIDGINYLVILAAYLEDRRRASKAPTRPKNQDEYG